ncbi:MAG: flagellar basal body P-ring formation protein FlgA [Variibacter sp.]|nr:flagellar basal body P-ring formation protein FlgA [Variibacter sp.]
MLRALLLVALLALAGPRPAAAAGDPPPPAPSLKADATVTSDIVRIGDLVENAGEAANVPIFRAPDLGQTGTVRTGQVLDAIRRHGLVAVETHGLTEVTVTRRAREIGLEEIESRIVAALAQRYGLGPASDLAVTFDRDAHPLLVDPAAGEPRVLSASYDRYSGRFDVTFVVPGRGGAARQKARYVGTLAETAEVPTLARPLARGDVVRPGDVRLERQPKANIRPGTLTSLDQIVGLAARHALRAGQALSAADLMKPELVVKNEAVTITYERPGMVLSLRGKALESGAEGDVVTVFNAQSKRTLQGVVVGPGRVSLVTTFASTPAGDVTGSIAAKAPSPRTE